MVVNQTQGEVERLMRDGQSAAKRGDKVMARALLTQLLETDPHNEQAWMWLSGAVDDKEEQRTCLENVLILNPNNAQARKGLDFLLGKKSTQSAPRPTAMLEAGAPPVPPDMPYPSAPSAGPTPAPSQAEQASYGAPADPAMWPGGSGTAGTAVPGGTRGEVHSTPFPVPGLDDQQPFDPSVLAPPQDGVFSGFDASGGLNLSAEPSYADFGSQSAESAAEVPDWVSSLTGGAAITPGADAGTPSNATFAFPEPSGTQLLPGEAEHAQGEAPAAAATPDVPQNGAAAATATGEEVDMNAWLQDLQSAAKPFEFTESHDTSGGLNGFAAPHDSMPPTGTYQTDPLAGPPAAFEAGMAGGAAGFDGLMGGSAASAGYDPMDPFYGAQLPSPEELPGGGSEEAENSQPWYLRSSNQSTSASSSFEEPYGIGYPTDDRPAQPKQSAPAAPVVMVSCPNCRTEVPDTTLACPQCRYSFFVHCPHCHELIDNTNARDGVIEGCPYCGAQVNRMDLGRSGATGVVRPLAAPRETKLEWTGEADDAPKRRSLAVTFGWLIDLMWLMVIVLMVWALTQLPTWLHLTDLYN